MTTQNKIKTDIFLAAIMTFFFCFISGSIVTFSKFEGTIGDGIIINFIADYTIYLFPLVFLYGYFKLDIPSVLLLLIVLNVLIYSFIMIRLFTKKLSNSKKYKPFNLTVVTAYVIPSVILLCIIYLIATSQ